MKTVEIISDPFVEKTEKIRLAAYCRVSTDKTDQLNSFIAQIKYYSDYAKKNTQYELVDIYADEGLTGTDMKKRNEFNRLLNDCKKRKIDRVITKSTSRFARNTQDFLIVIRMLKEIGVSVYFEEQGIDTGKLNMEMFAAFPGLISQQESENISQNMRWSYQKRMQSGEFNTNNAPYGFVKENGELLINDKEAHVVQRIFDMYISGYGMQRIANLLNEEKTPLKYGHTHWTAATIKYMLNNERYMGDALLQKSYKTETLPFRKIKNRGEKAQYYIENSNVSIISKETFEAAQMMQRTRAKNRKANTKIYPLSKKIRCADCGKTYRRMIVNNTAYWLCSSRASGITNCTNLRIREKDIYDAFNELVIKLQDNREKIILPTIRYIELMQGKNGENQQKIFVIDKKIADYTAQSHTLAKLHTKGVLDNISYTQRSSVITDKIINLRSERRRVLNETEEHELIATLKNIDGILQEYIPGSEFDEKVFEQIIEKITPIDNTRLRFTLYGGLSFIEKI